MLTHIGVWVKTKINIFKISSLQVMLLGMLCKNISVFMPLNLRSVTAVNLNNINHDGNWVNLENDLGLNKEKLTR